MNKYLKRGIIAFICFILFIIFNPLYIITSGNKGLSFRFGAIQSNEIDPGLHIRMPIVEKIKSVSIQPQRLDYDVPVGTDGAITSDNQTIGASVVVFYKFKSGNLVSLYQDYGIDNMKNIIQSTVKDSVKSTMGQYTIFDIASSQNKITSNVTLNVKDKLSSYPIDITELKITNYDWSDEFDAQIKDTMTKKQQVLAKEQEVLIAKQEADKLVNQAEAEKKVQITKAEGEKESAQLKAEAKALEGEGIRKYNESIAKNLDVQIRLKQLDIEQARVDKWNGQYVSTNNYTPIPVSNSSLLGEK